MREGWKSQGIIITIIAAVYEGLKVESQQLRVAEAPLKLKLGFPVKVSLCAKHCAECVFTSALLSSPPFSP